MIFVNNVPVIIDGTEFNVKISESGTNLETDEYLIRLLKDSRDLYTVSAYIKTDKLHSIVEDVHIYSINQIQLLIQALKSYKIKYERK